MSWRAQLKLDYTLEAGRTVARFAHDGPLRILQSLYPESDAVCHNVLVHPPGGLVGGDTLEIRVSARGDSHGLITTPGATRFYKSDGERALQDSRIELHDNARLEWLPMESLCHSGCIAENRLRIALAQKAEFIGWDVTALGLPHANAPFERGSFLQHIELPGVWMERGRIDALDGRLMNGPVGLAGNRCLASLFFVAGSKIDRARNQRALDAARAAMDTLDLAGMQVSAGATSPNGQVVIVRVLAPVVEPAMRVLKPVWAAWRAELWGMTAAAPRIWST
jgi:urease accessory protein